MNIRFYINILITVTALAAASVAQAADTKIAVVDVQQIVRNSLAAKDIAAQMEKKRLAYQSEITKQEEDLKKKDQDLSKQRGVLAPDAFDQKVKEFKTQAAEVQRTVQQRRSELDHAYGNALAVIQKGVYDIISKLSEERGFAIAIPTSQILFAKKDLDISDEVLKRLNVQLPKVTVTVEKPAAATKAKKETE